MRSSALLGLLLVSACGRAPQPPTSSPVAPPTSEEGYLQGLVSIGPLQPVERVGLPTPTPPPAVCTSRGLVVYSADTGAELRRVAFASDCTYRVALKPGSYRVELDRQGIDTSRDLPRAVTIESGQTTQLDVRIDTGIR